MKRTFVSKETERLMLQCHLELSRERKDELALMELRKALYEFDERNKAYKAALLNTGPELAKQLAPYIKAINDNATSLQDRKEAARQCIGVVDRFTARSASLKN